jgi:hypothetical protein
MMTLTDSLSFSGLLGEESSLRDEGAGKASFLKNWLTMLTLLRLNYRVDLSSLRIDGALIESTYSASPLSCLNSCFSNDGLPFVKIGSRSSTVRWLLVTNAYCSRRSYCLKVDTLCVLKSGESRCCIGEPHRTLKFYVRVNMVLAK